MVIASSRRSRTFVFSPAQLLPPVAAPGDEATEVTAVPPAGDAD